MAEAGTSLEALDRVLGTKTAEAGPQALTRIVRDLSGRSQLSEAELRMVADAQLNACEGLADRVRCTSNASEQVSGLLNQVCRRQVGNPPSAPPDSFAMVKYDIAVGSCVQPYSSTLLEHFDSKARDAIRNIRKD
jgi:hypothetical protein